jgi:uridine phosphorylase
LDGWSKFAGGAFSLMSPDRRRRARAARVGRQMPARLRPTAPIAADAILVGDPGRALMLAQELLEQPKMSNHARGLWGYGGRTAAGDELTIQSTGMGGPSASVVLADLAELGVRRAIRIGTCSSLGEHEPGDLVVVTAARAHLRGSPLASERTGEPRDEGRVLPDEALTEGLARELGGAASPGTVISLDTLHRPGADEAPPAAEVADMQTAALFETGASLEVAVAAVLAVAHAHGVPDLGDEELGEAVKGAGTAAVTLLSTSS